jgi:hypothetical protein
MSRFFLYLFIYFCLFSCLLCSMSCFLNLLILLNIECDYGVFGSKLFGVPFRSWNVCIGGTIGFVCVYVVNCCFA